MGEIDDEPQPSDPLSGSPESDLYDSMDSDRTLAPGVSPPTSSSSDHLNQTANHDDDFVDESEDGFLTIAPTSGSTKAPSVGQTRPEDVPSKPNQAAELVDEACDVTSELGRPDCERSQPEDTIAGEATQQRIGRYEIKRLLGEGAFGKVFLARDPQLDRIVALKVAKSASGQTQIQRFTLEARAAAHLRHPFIIPVYEYGQIDGLGYIVYEFVEGETLGSMSKRLGRITFDSAVDIVREIAEGLHYAHEQGIIHRDMKPDNVMLDNQSGIHIADFGCARSEKEQLNLTADDSIIGTPFYMSPEQASGKANKADGRADIWSLGVMFYELLSGERPFDGSLQEVLYWICNNDPKPLRKIDRGIPIDLETICNRCLNRDVNDRFLKAGDLADELTRFQNGEPIKSRRIGVVRRSWMWAKRNQTVASLIATVITVLLLGTFFSLSYAFGLKQEQSDHVNTQIRLLQESEASALPSVFKSLGRIQHYDDIRGKLARASEGFEDPEQKFRVNMALFNLEIAENDEKSELSSSATELLKSLADELLKQSGNPELFEVCCDLLQERKESLKGKLWEIVRPSGDAKQKRLSADNKEKLFCASVALAKYDPNSSEWKSDQLTELANELTSRNQIELARWLPAVYEIRGNLTKPLLKSFKDDRPGQVVEANRAAVALSRLYEDKPEWLVNNLLPYATDIQISYVVNTLRVTQDKAIDSIKKWLRDEENREGVDSLEAGTASISGQANMVVALIELDSDYQWAHFEWGEDPSLTAEIIERVGPASTSFDILLRRLELWRPGDADSREDEVAGILLALGGFRQNQISIERKNEIKPVLLKLFETHPSARVHSSVKWLMMRLGDRLGWVEEMADVEKSLRQELPDEDKSWHVDTRGNTFIVFDPVPEFHKGLGLQSSLTENGFRDELGEFPQHLIRIPRRFGICTTEVTVEDFEHFEEYLIEELPKWVSQIERNLVKLKEEKQKSSETPASSIDEKIKLYEFLADQFPLTRKEIERKQEERAGSSKKLPVNNEDFLMALAFCSWVSKQEGVGDPQAPLLWKVPELLREHYRSKETVPGGAIEFFDKKLDKTYDYRLPTAAEWEYACRGKSQTTFPVGRSGRLLGKYAWYARNSYDATVHPVGQLKPLSTGGFDMLGNVSEWCLDFYVDSLPKPDASLEFDTTFIYEDHGPKFFSFEKADGLRLSVGRGTTREVRGGSYISKEDKARATARDHQIPISGLRSLGFRLARTYPPKKDK